MFFNLNSSLPWVALAGDRSLKRSFGGAKVFGKPVFRTNLSRLPWVGIDRAVSYLESHLPLVSARLCAVICTLRSPAGPSVALLPSPFGPSVRHRPDLDQISFHHCVHHFHRVRSGGVCYRNPCCINGPTVSCVVIKDTTVHVGHNQRPYCVLWQSKTQLCMLVYHHNQWVLYRHDCGNQRHYCIGLGVSSSQSAGPVSP